MKLKIEKINVKMKILP